MQQESAGTMTFVIAYCLSAGTLMGAGLVTLMGYLWIQQHCLMGAVPILGQVVACRI